MTAALTIDNPAYFDRLAELEAAHWWSAGMWRLASYWLGAAVRGRNGLEALDVGCGTGLTALRLAQRPEIDAVVGLDLSPEALAHARGRHDFALVRGSALDLPFDDSRFDVVTCFDVLQHLPPGGDRRAIAELFRVLRPGGVALVRSNAAAGATHLPDPSAGYRLSALIALFQERGFLIRRASYANCLPALAQELRGRWSKAAALGHPAGGGLRMRMRNPWSNRLMGRISAAEAAFAGRLGGRLPFGHSTILWAERAGVT